MRASGPLNPTNFISVSVTCTLGKMGWERLGLLFQCLSGSSWCLTTMSLAVSKAHPSQMLPFHLIFLSKIGIINEEGQEEKRNELTQKEGKKNWAGRGWRGVTRMGGRDRQVAGGESKDWSTLRGGYTKKQAQLEGKWGRRERNGEGSRQLFCRKTTGVQVWGRNPQCTCCFAVVSLSWKGLETERHCTERGGSQEYQLQGDLTG